MNWTDDEVDDVETAGAEGGTKMAMTRALELAAARCGTVGVVLPAHLGAVMDTSKSTSDRLNERRAIESLFATQGATVATLQAKVAETKRQAVEGGRRWQGQVDELRAEVERLKAEVEQERALRRDDLAALAHDKQRAMAAESRLAAIRERGQQEIDRLREEYGQSAATQKLRWVLDGKEP